MAVRMQYEKLDDIPEADRESYTENKEGKWVLTIPELVDLRATNDEFRSNNRTMKGQMDNLSSELGQLRKDYQGVDLERYRRSEEMIAALEADEEKALIAKGDIAAVVQRRTASAISAKEDELKQRISAYSDLEAKYTKVQTQFQSREVQTQLLDEINVQRLRVRPGAAEDLNARLGSDWKLNDEGKLVSNGIFGEDGGDITKEAYVKRLLDKRSFFFEPAVGGDGEGNKGDEIPDGVIKIPRGDTAMKAKYVEEIASGKAVVVG